MILIPKKNVSRFKLTLVILIWGYKNGIFKRVDWKFQPKKKTPWPNMYFCFFFQYWRFYVKRDVSNRKWTILERKDVPTINWKWNVEKLIKDTKLIFFLIKKTHPWRSNQIFIQNNYTYFKSNGALFIRKLTCTSRCNHQE